MAARSRRRLLSGWRFVAANRFEGGARRIVAGERSQHRCGVASANREYLDQGHGSSWLKDARVASMVQQALLHFDGSRYKLSAWVVMPNHLHLILTPNAEYQLSGILHSLKSYTAHEANRILGREGQFWQDDYFDRYIRDAKHFAAAVAYVESNPVKAGLCRRIDDWPYGSARLRKL